MSEIDDIFASKGKAKDVLPPVASSSSQPSKSSDTGKKKKQNKRKKLHTDLADPEPSNLSKRPTPETVVDPSIQLSDTKRRKVDKPGSVSKKSKKDAPEDTFKDSRGSGSRRKTDEGWSIYKEDELGISQEGGDTPLCPFDCECCF